MLNALTANIIVILISIILLVVISLDRMNAFLGFAANAPSVYQE